ncbi:MAG: hypothetical protein F4X36_04040 [Gammaproteobacteria bacterium]|nr:hypothetical protein [Gammaproteobacteria bacterium]
MGQDRQGRAPPVDGHARMSEWRGIDELHLSPLRPGRSVPKVPARLLEAIRRHGPIAPVVVRRVREHHYEILGNAETWLAAQRLGQERVPVEVLPDVEDEDVAAIVEATTPGLAENPLEEARHLAERLDDLGGRSRWGATRRLAATTGLSRSYISHAVRLLRLPDDVQELVRSGRLGVGHAKLLVGLRDPGAQRAAARRIVAEGLSVRATETLVRDARNGDLAPAAAGPEEADPDILRLERTLSDTLGCMVRIRAADGTLTRDYGGDLDVLDGVLRRIGITDF